MRLARVPEFPRLWVVRQGRGNRCVDNVTSAGRFSAGAPSRAARGRLSVGPVPADGDDTFIVGCPAAVVTPVAGTARATAGSGNTIGSGM
ncbi:hypothetical protein FRAAL4148 [Frankia alni ACN14a]|uniref:Uncharacterized protein n=1 Tax=Frankia alni (strain DSM 45986 / CECT 9034 / ACN14a) TaxID=326424 RepID=Q0RI81_FRAAA|nr:hypothetical protein FRAAL4148 [Frankia alni ACN14a]